jgi:Tol biopolymer transport system component
VLKRGAFALVLASALAPGRARAADALRQPDRLTVGLSDELLGQLSPDGHRLFFISNRNSTSQIFTQDLNAAGATLLFDESADVTWPRVSPDGKHLLYISFREDAAGDLCVRDLKRLERACLPDESTAIQAQWMNDGSLALVSRSSLQGDFRLERVRVGHKLRTEVLVDRNLVSPTISPDGKWLVYVPLERYAKNVGPGFAAKAERTLGALRLNAPGAQPVEMAFDLPGATGQPAFSDDGRWLYFTQYLDDSNRDGVIDGSDHGVVFRVPWAGGHYDDPARAAHAVPEQLTSSSWNCQYPSPARDRVVMTCSRDGSLDLYALPLDGVVPATWTRERLREELHVSRRRLEQLLLLAHLYARETSPPERVALTMHVIRLHLALGELESAAFYARRLAKLGDADADGLSEVVLTQIEHRQAQRSLEHGAHGKLSARFVEDERRRADVLAPRGAASQASAGVEAYRALVRSEIADTVGDKAAARTELSSITVAPATPRYVLEALAERADALYRELDDRDALVAVYRALAAHPAFDATYRVQFARQLARSLAHGLGADEAAALIDVELKRAAPDSEVALELTAERWLRKLKRGPAPADVTEALLALYAQQRTVERRRALVLDVVQRAAEHDADELVEKFAHAWVSSSPEGSTERRRAEKLYKQVIEERAYSELQAGDVERARADFLDVTRRADSLESHVSYIELGLRAGVTVKALEEEYERRFAAAGGDAPLPHFVRAYLMARRLPSLDGDVHERAVTAALDELGRAAAALRQKSEMQALHGALMHERYLHTRALDAAEEANLHYLLALDLAHENPRYKAMISEQLALLHSLVGNHRIALGWFETRETLPFLDARVELGHKLAEARSLLHVGRDADAAHTAEEALALVERSSQLAAWRAPALDRAALYALSAGEAARAAVLYAQGAPLVDAERGDAGRRNQLTNRLGHAAASLGAAQPAAALADLALIDARLAEPGSLGALRWPHATEDEVLATYRLLALGLRARAHRALEQLPEAARALEGRRQLLLDRLKRKNVDEDLSSLAMVEEQLAENARARKDGASAARWIAFAVGHTDELAKRTATPLHPAGLETLSFAAELYLGGDARDFGFDVPARVRATFADLASKHNPAWRAVERRFERYVALLALGPR